MTIPAAHCEARKVAYRQTKDGLVVSFVVHPNDMPDALAVAPLGQRYMLALAAIGDDEQPVPNLVPVRQETKFSSETKSQRGKERYASSTPMEQALVRAAQLSKDERFIAWISVNGNYAEFDRPQRGAAYIREHCCEGKSRGLIAEDPECYRRYLEMETEFKIATGEMAEPR